MIFETHLQETEQIENILKDSPSSITALSKPVEGRMSLTEAMAQSASLHFKHKTQFSGHTFIGSVKNVKIDSVQIKSLLEKPEKKQRSVFIQAELLSFTNGKSGLYQVTAHTKPSEKAIGQAQILIIKEAWGQTFQADLIKEASINRFHGLLEKGTSFNE